MRRDESTEDAHPVFTAVRVVEGRVEQSIPDAGSSDVRAHSWTVSTTGAGSSAAAAGSTGGVVAGTGGRGAGDIVVAVIAGIVSMVG